jgi:hypothetical protein
MGELRSQDKRDKLRLLYAQTQGADGKRLQDVLMAALAAADAAISGATPGTFLSSTNEGGGSASFQALSDLSPAMAKRLIGELLDLYDWVTAGADNPNPVTSDQDADIYAAMMQCLVAIRRFRNDYTGLRYGVGFYLGAG